jgi:hypothetical protein
MSSRSDAQFGYRQEAQGNDIRLKSIASVIPGENKIVKLVVTAVGLA